MKAGALVVMEEGMSPVGMSAFAYMQRRMLF